MVRIAHISDSHLGSSLFQLAERKEDARRCLEKAVDMAMRHSPDVLVHTGDLFDNHYPTMEDMSFAMKLFKKIKDDVMTIVIQGNHDMPYGFRYGLSPLRVLENAGLIISTEDKTHRSVVGEFDGKKMEFHLVSWTGNQTIASLLNSKTPTEDNAVFLAHYIPIKKENLPIHFSYYGFGHAHNFWLDQEYDIGRPGSTCIVDWKREEGGKKKLIVVDIDNGKNEYTTETLNDVREFKFLTGLDVTGMGTEEIELSIRRSINALSPKKTKPIIILKINGVIDSETEEGIQRAEILKYGEEKLKPLFFHVEPNWECFGPRAITLSEPLNLENSVEEYMEQTGVAESERILSELQKIMES